MARKFRIIEYFVLTDTPPPLPEPRPGENMYHISRYIWMAILFACVPLSAQMQFSADAKLDVWAAGVRATSTIGNLDFRFSKDRVLEFNVIWGLSGPAVAGALTKGGWQRTLQVGVSAGGVANRTTTESLIYEVKVIQVTDDSAIVVVVWTRSDSLTGASEGGTLVICTVNKTAPNRISPAGDGARMSSVLPPQSGTGTSPGISGPGISGGFGGSSAGGSWQEVITHGQWHEILPNGTMVIHGWISVGTIWVPNGVKPKRVQELY